MHYDYMLHIHRNVAASHSAGAALKARQDTGVHYLAILLYAGSYSRQYLSWSDIQRRCRWMKVHANAVRARCKRTPQKRSQ